MTHLKAVFVSICLLFIAGCYYGNEEDLFPDSECVTENVSFQNVVMKIIDTNCIVCHSAGANLGNVNLSSYDNVKVYVNNGKLLGAIRREPGFSPMPQNAAQLRSCDIDRIASWISAGSPNN